MPAPLCSRAMRLLLISSSLVHGHGYLDHAEAELRDFLGATRRLLFVPFAQADHEAYTARVRDRLTAMGLEVDGLYMNRSVQAGGLGITGTTSAGYIYVPAMLRFHLAHPVALGVGGYYYAPISSGNPPSDYGLVGSLRFYLAPTFFIDGRYNYGLKSGGTIVTGGDKTSEVMGLIGFSFGGGH